MHDVTQVLNAIQNGDAQAAEQLLPLMYDELRQLAGRNLAQEAPGQTLNATALVHEAYLRLVSNQPDAGERDSWNSRGHFFAAAAEAMRRILIENARRKRTEKHGGRLNRIDLDAVACVTAGPTDDLLALDDALTRLAREDAVKAELVNLRYFAGLTIQEAADVLGISRATADRYWVYAKVWLYQAVTAGTDSSQT